MAGIEPEEILLTKLSKLFGGPEHVKAYEALKTDSERINFVYHSPIVTELFKLQSQALKKSIHERSGEGKKSVHLYFCKFTCYNNYIEQEWATLLASQATLETS